MAAHGADGKPIGRRVFLGMLGMGAAGIVWGGKASDAVSRLLAPFTAKDGTGLTSLIPTGGRFRFYSVVHFNPSPTRDAFRLKVGGRVLRTLDLTYADLKAMPSVRLVKDFQCVTGWRVPSVKAAGRSWRRRSGCRSSGRSPLCLRCGRVATWAIR